MAADCRGQSAPDHCRRAFPVPEMRKVGLRQAQPERLIVSGAYSSLSPPTAVILDVGNVLYGWDPESLLARQLPEDEARLRFIEDVDLWGWHVSLDGGRRFDETAAELSEKFPDYAAHISAWGERFGETISDPVPGMHAIVEELDSRGVPLFAITNFSADF